MVQLASLVQRAVKIAQSLGATEAEAFASKTVQNRLTFHEKMESAKTSQITGIGVRAIVEKKIGFSSCSYMEEQDLENAVRTAVAIAKASQPDPDWHSLAKRGGKARVNGTHDKRTAEIGIDTLVQRSVEIIDSVHARDSRLTPARGSVTTGKLICAMTNSNGSEFTKKGTYALFSIRVRAEDGAKMGNGDEGCEARSWRAINFDHLVEEASQRAIRSLDASPIHSTKASVIFANDVFARILDVMFTNTINAEAVQKGRSPWMGRLGQQIASDTFTAVDDGMKKEGMMTWSFDDEGTPQQRTPIIERGILRSYLYDAYTAAKSQTASTGNARRSRSSLGMGRPYRRTPTPSPTNFVLKPSDTKRDELIEETRYGLLVLTTIGEWLSNPMSGALSATVTNGILVKKGELSDPVKGVIASGNFFEMIRRRIDLIANDTRNDGNFYSPSVRIREMSIAGR